MGITSDFAAEFWALPSQISRLDQIDFDAQPDAVATVEALDTYGTNGSFWTGGQADDFAARYSTTLNVTEAGSYTFYLTSDDGSSLSIDGQSIIDNDGLHAPLEQTVTLNLTVGDHPIELLYFEAFGGATLALDWSGPDTDGVRQNLSSDTSGDDGGDTGGTGEDTGHETGNAGTPVYFILGQSNAQILYHSGAVQDILEDLGSDARVVPVAGGGESVADPDGAWNVVTGDGADAPGWLYTEFLSSVDDLRAVTPDLYISGAIWVQGEADAYAITPYYETTRALFEAMHEDTGEEFPIAVVGLSDFHNLPDGPREHVQDAQIQLSEDLDYVAHVDTDAIIAEQNLSRSFVMRDDLHYNLEFFPFIARDAVQQLPGGGGGNDTADYSSSASGVTVLLWNGVSEGGDAEGDSLIGIENVIGSAHADILAGNYDEDNMLDGGDGNDILRGRSGNDTLIGGDGNDILRGRNGNDTLNGGADTDSLNGGMGDDTLIGGDGADQLAGNRGADILNGGAGTDSLNGDKGDDTLIGGDDADILNGGAGTDSLNGDKGDDTLIGGYGADILNGGAGTDSLNGGMGADTLIGGYGADILNGGAGTDSFVFKAGDGRDTISDFTDGQDGLTLLGGLRYQDLNREQVGDDVLITYGDGDEILVENILRSQLTADDMTFVA